MNTEVSTKPDLEKDILNSKVIVEKAKERNYAVRLYNSLCNNAWIKDGEEWLASWRYAGGIASILHDGADKEDYMNFYINDDTCPGMVDDEVIEDFAALGWELVPYED